MQHHLFQDFVAFCGIYDLDDLHLVELMEAVKTTDILAVAARFPAEAGSVSRHLYRELGFFQHLVPIDIGHRNFRCRYEVKVVLAYIVHLTFFFGKLSRAPGGSLIHEDGRLIFCIARGRVEIEEVLDERPLQFRSLVDVYRESASRDLVPQLEIDEIVFFCKVPMWNGFAGQSRMAASFTDRFIIFRRSSLWYGSSRQIGQTDQYGIQLLFYRGELFCDRRLRC